MKITLPVTKYQEFDIDEEVMDNILLMVLYEDYHTVVKENFSEDAEFIKAMKKVYEMYSGSDIEDVREKLH